jgi:hypothetical protein
MMFEKCREDGVIQTIDATLTITPFEVADSLIAYMVRNELKEKERQWLFATCKAKYVPITTAVKSISITFSIDLRDCCC